MLTQKEIVEILKKNYPYLRDNFEIKRIGLFGSFAKGQESAASDIDVLVELKKPIGLKFIVFAEYMEKLLSKKVDILTLEGIKSIRLKKVANSIKRSIRYV
ncbi:MAG: nucleotidyltransferase domain-containing protein [Candidatus Omnitrophota bacterium]|nr:nucleotidyltransferase domain-containing protein [Candidatus Omnitrophota bacterium]